MCESQTLRHLHPCVFAETRLKHRCLYQAVHCPDVALAIDRQDVRHFAQYEGRATFLDERSEREAAAKLLEVVYPRARYWPGVREVRFVRVDPILMLLTKGPPGHRGDFGKVDRLRFDEKGEVVIDD